MNLIVHRRTLLARIWEQLGALLPRWLVALYRGPRVRHELGASPPNRLMWRPVDVEVPEQLVLTRRLLLPREARADLEPAIGLMVRRETPFAAADLLIHAEELPPAEGSRDATYLLRMTPVALLRRELERARLWPLRSGSVRLGAGRAAAGTLNARRGPLQLIALVPVAAILAASTSLWLGELTARADRRAVLELTIEERTAQIAVLARRIDTEREGASARDSVLAVVAASPSIHERLRWLSLGLPRRVEVLRLESDGSGLRIAARSPDLLADIDALNARGGSWSAAIMGALATDSTSGLDQAVIAVTKGAAR